jgi:hypothetical protein
MALLVAPTEEAFANGILALIRSPDLRRRLGRRAQQFAQEKFDYAGYLAKMDRVYQELLPLSCMAQGAGATLQADPAGSRKASLPASPRDIGR